MIAARPVDRICVSQMNAELFLNKYRARRPFIMTNVPPLVGAPACDQLIRELLHLLSSTCDTVEVMRAHDNSNFLDDQTHVDKIQMKTNGLINDVLSDAEDKTTGQLYYYRQAITVPRQLAIVNALLTAMITPLLGIEDNRIGEPVLWLGTEGNITPCHYDSAHVFMIQLKGTKRWTIFPSQDSRLMYSYDAVGGMSNRKIPSKHLVSDFYLNRQMREGPYHASRLRNLNQIWNTGIGLDKTHSIALNHLFKDGLDHGPFVATLNEGEVLFNPAGYWHEVVSDTACISISVPLPLTKSDVESTHVPVNLLF